MQTPTSPREFSVADFGEASADIYDQYLSSNDAGPTADFLTALAASMPAGRATSVVDLGCGTGALACMLAARGMAVTAVDASPRMLEAVRARDAGGRITTVCSTFADLALSPPYDLVVSTTATFNMEPSQDGQVRLLQRCAAMLAPHGRVVLHLNLPGWFLSKGETSGTRRLPDGTLSISLATNRFLEQVIDGVILLVTSDRRYEIPLRSRYFTIGELDLMARIAGLVVIARYADWTGRELVDQNGSMVAVLAHAR